MSKKSFSAPDKDLADLRVHGYASERTPGRAKYLLISKGVDSKTFHPLLIIHSDTPVGAEGCGPVCALTASFQLFSTQLTGAASVESKLHALLSGHNLSAYSIDTTHPLDLIASGDVLLDLDGYPNADVINKLFYSLRNRRRRSN